MRTRRIQFTGLVSYSLYLWHEPLMLSLEKHHVLVFKEAAIWPLSTVALVVAGLVVAWCSYHVIEVPGRRLPRLLAIPRPRPPRQIRRSGDLRVRRGTEVATLPALRG